MKVTSLALVAATISAVAAAPKSQHFSSYYYKQLSKSLLFSEPPPCVGDTRSVCCMEVKGNRGHICELSYCAVPLDFRNDFMWSRGFLALH